MSIQAKVEIRIKRIQKGLPFAINGFYKLGSRAAVQKALSRLTKLGEIFRLQRGIYCRPKPLKSLPSLTVTASAEQVAQLWARQHKYKLVSQGLEEAYRLGLQTQAPITKLYWTNGPSREFLVGNQKVVVKHIGENLLKWSNAPEGRLLRALSVFGESELPNSAFKQVFSRLQIAGQEANELLNKLTRSQEISKFIPQLRSLVV